MKKKYSQALRLLGRDSIFVMLMRKRRKAARARCSAPTLSTRLIMRLVRSWPVGGLLWRPNTRNRVALAALSWMADSGAGSRYFSAASWPAIAAEFFCLAVSSAERAFEEVSMISTRGRLFCTQARHCASAWGCANSFLIWDRRELLSRQCWTRRTI